MDKQHIWAPTVQPFVFDEDLEKVSGGGDRSLRGIDIFADGTLHFTDTHNNTVTLTFTGVAPFVRYVMQIKKIFSDSTIPLASLVGLK